MIASDYPVTFGYGATDGEYYGPNGSIGPYHRGDDRAMPVGTPVVVNGVSIGLSGNGNGAYGAHLHVGKWVAGKDVNPNSQGFTLEGATVTKVLNDYSDPVNGKYVWILDANGATWVYLHMKQVNVVVGQKLEGGDMIENETQNDLVFITGVSRHAYPQEVGRYIGKSWEFALNDVLKNADRLVQDNVIRGASETLDVARIFAFFLGGRLNALDGGQDADLKKNHVGANVTQDLWAWYNSAEAQAWKAKIQAGAVGSDAYKPYDGPGLFIKK